MKSASSLSFRATLIALFLVVTIVRGAADATWVDFRAGNGTGLPGNPFDNLSNALRAASSRGNIICKPGSSETSITINQSVTISSDGGAVVVGIGLPQPVKQYNFVTHNWEPFFSFGYYIEEDTCYTEPGHSIPWGLLEASRANTIVAVDMKREYDSCIQSVLAGAQARGLKVVLGINRALISSVASGDPNAYAPLREFVQSYGGHPALLGWLLGDENDTKHDNEPFLEPQTVSAAAVLIHSWDEYHQIWQVFSGLCPDPIYPTQLCPYGTSGPGHGPILPYLGGTDVVLTDQYSEAPNVSTFGGADRTLKYVWHGRDFVGKGRAWGVVTQGIGTDVNNPLPYRLPYKEEFRWNVLSALAAGRARTIQAWMLPSPLEKYYSTPAIIESFLTNSVAPVYVELGKIKHGMETGYSVGQVSVSSTTAGYQMPSALLLYDSISRKYYLIVANVGTLPLSVTITLSSLPIGPLAPTADRYGSSVPVTPINGGLYRLESSLTNHEAVIYSISVQ
ncbi:MAG: hypothetical protein JWM16_4240 [Verrucomicrobiales bacterium]|nr:hypothetical protein [Verrucomicrobiales bacterium]